MFKLTREEIMKILIATDGSTFSQKSITKLCQLIVNATNPAIKIVSVYPIVIPLDEFTPSAEYSEKLEKAQRAQAESAAEEAAATIRQCLPGEKLDLTTEIIIGNPPLVIVDTAEKWNADLIVMGSHGRGFWKRMLLGSVSGAVVHHAPCSVLVIRDAKTLSENMQAE
jgi:nucleotide-binding universal stress UspA family protein